MTKQKTPFEIYEDNSFPGQREALIDKMLNAVNDAVDPEIGAMDSQLTEDQVFERLPAQLVHEALVGLAIVLLTYNWRKGDDLQSRLEEFLSDVRHTYNGTHPDDKRTLH